MIEKYLLSTCLFIIDDFNFKFSNTSKEQLKRIADIQFSEADIVIRLGYPFKDMANFNMQGNSHDIVVKSKDFVTEVKYLRNTKSASDSYSGKLTWEDAFKTDYNWLCSEIKRGKKGNRAFVLGWFNAVDRFSQIMQLGEGGGMYPLINHNRLRLFPFLNYNGEQTRNIFYMYSNAYKPLQIHIPGYEKEVVECLFLGNEDDKFHFAIYY